MSSQRPKRTSATIGATGAVSMSGICLIISAGAFSANSRAARIVSAPRPCMLADCQMKSML